MECAAYGRTRMDFGVLSAERNDHLKGLVSRGIHICSAIVSLLLILVSSAAAQGRPSEVRVAVTPVPPFVMQHDGSLTGFSIDLWNAIAARMNTKTDYQLIPDVATLIEVMRTKKADIVASPVVITAARDQEFDFSFPTMQYGLQIMTLGKEEMDAPNPLEELLFLLFSKTTLAWLGIAFVLVLVPGHVVWIFERRQSQGIISDRRYFPGIFEAMYWALSCLTEQAETMPHQWIARAFSVFWMFAGVVFVAFYTAQLTTTLTVRQIRGSINGAEDLPGKQVGTIANSTAANYLRAINAKITEYQNIDEMFQALLNKQIDAVVFSSPVLLYYAAHEGKGLVKTVGAEFNVDPIAITCQLDSPLRRPINTALLSLREDGNYQRIYNRWFGS